MVLPDLSSEESKEFWRQGEHGDTRVEHLVDSIDEPLGFRVHDLLQHPQALPKHDIGDGCSGRLRLKIPFQPGYMRTSAPRIISTHAHHTQELSLILGFLQRRNGDLNPER